MSGKSCVGCKFLYSHDYGYSDYTVEDTAICCALDLNPNLSCDEPYDWNKSAEHDNWGATQNSRCDRYAAGEMVELNVDHGDIEEYSDDAEVIAAIKLSVERI